MILFLFYVVLYVPPVLGAYLCYRHERKKQENFPNKNYMTLYLLPFVLLLVFSVLWSGFLYIMMTKVLYPVFDQYFF